MGFVSDKEAERFLAIYPETEKYIIDAGIILIKFWPEVGPDEQERRFLARVNNPPRQWKLSPMDLESYQRWYGYSRARDMMLKATDADHAPSHIVRSEAGERNKRRRPAPSHLRPQSPILNCETRYICRPAMSRVCHNSPSKSGSSQRVRKPLLLS
jgi:hypothetical protein